jgi:hypothetical protein
VLREAKARQIPGEPRRRWFRDDDFDLYVWYRPDGGFAGFQLCYDKLDDEHAFTWLANKGATHHRVDEPQRGMFAKQTPILVAGRSFPAARVREAFLTASAELDTGIRAFVVDVLGQKHARA